MEIFGIKKVENKRNQGKGSKKPDGSAWEAWDDRWQAWDDRWQAWNDSYG